MLDGLIFGFIDNGVVLLGSMLACVNIEPQLARLMGRKSSPAIAAIVGATASNTISDCCLLPVLAIPFLTRFIKEN